MLTLQTVRDALTWLFTVGGRVDFVVLFNQWELNLRTRFGEKEEVAELIHELQVNGCTVVAGQVIRMRTQTAKDELKITVDSMTLTHNVIELPTGILQGNVIQRVTVSDEIAIGVLDNAPAYHMIEGDRHVDGTMQITFETSELDIKELEDRGFRVAVVPFPC